MLSHLFQKGLLKDKSGLPEGDGKETRVARFIDMKDIEEKNALESVINE